MAKGEWGGGKWKQSQSATITHDDLLLVSSLTKLTDPPPICQLPLDATCVCMTNLDAVTPSAIRTHTFAHTSLPSVSIYTPDIKLRVVGAKALVPALKQMTQMTKFALNRKYWMALA